MNMMQKAVKARKGIVMNPNQLIYSPLHGIRAHPNVLSEKKDNFWMA